MNSAEPSRDTAIIVNGLCCATEEQLIRRKLASLSGVRDLRFNFVTHTLTVRHTCEAESILRSLHEIGLPGKVQESRMKPAPRKTPRSQLLSALLSGAMLLAGGVVAVAEGPEWLAAACFLLSIVSGGWHIAFKGFKAARNLALDMNTLMTVAVIGAVILGEYAEGAAVIFLFALSLLLESLSIDRSRRAIHSLMKLSPPRASINRNGKETDVLVEDVAVGETMLIRPGERVPLDGVVKAGFTTIDQSTVTGESIPVPKRPGDSLFAGTMNQRGSLEARVTRPASDSTLARIIHLVEEAQSRRSPSQTFIEKFARSYTPTVFALAFLIAILPPLFLQQEFSEWFYRALVLLVIACPCALVISTPVAIVSAMTAAARRGILLKGGKTLEELAAIRAIAFDKTGTLTEGRPVLTDVVALNGMPETTILGIVTAAELRSEHHLADAFIRRAEETGIDIGAWMVESFESLPGKGVRATIDGATYVVGSHQLIEEMGICSDDVERRIRALEAEGKTVVLLATDSEVLGALAVSDRIRAETSDLVASLQASGLQHFVMLTGDSSTTAKHVSSQLRIDEHRAEMLPEDKLNVVRDLKNRFGAVAMVGDGVNDAPALAAADVGIAMGGIGSDASLESADVVLMSDELGKIPFALTLGKRTVTIIRQNVAIALATKAVFLVLAVFGMTSLWLAVLADDGATLVVILNGLRLLRNPGSLAKVT
jgi:Cd2+/Zn2+-exporting ATPase